MVERVALCWPPTAWCSSPSLASLSLSTLRTSSTPCGEDNKWTLSKHPGHNLGRVPDWNRGQRAWNSDQKVRFSFAGLWLAANGPKEPTANQPMLWRLYLPKSRILNIRLEQLECHHMHTLFILCDNPSHYSILNHMKVDDKKNVKNYPTGDENLIFLASSSCQNDRMER